LHYIIELRELFSSSICLLYITMWKQILSKVNASILAHWSQVVWFVVGTLAGAFLLGGLVSCSTVEAVEGAVGSVDDTIREVPVLGAVYAIPSDAVGGVYNLGKDGVEAVVETVTPEDEGK